MNPDLLVVPPEMKVAEFINRVLNNNRDTMFAVARDQRLHGMLLLEELKSVPRPDWTERSASEVMRPVDPSMFLDSSTPLSEAERMVAGNGLGRAVVLDRRGLIIGQVSISDFKTSRAT
jgi:predicted transcriptional regulator